LGWINLQELGIYLIGLKQAATAWDMFSLIFVSVRHRRMRCCHNIFNIVVETTFDSGVGFYVCTITTSFDSEAYFIRLADSEDGCIQSHTRHLHVLRISCQKEILVRQPLSNARHLTPILHVFTVWLAW
jgi:hypothetical protein